MKCRICRVRIDDEEAGIGAVNNSGLCVECIHDTLFLCSLLRK